MVKPGRKLETPHRFSTSVDDGFWWIWWSVHEPFARGLLGTGRQRGPVFEAQVTTKCILSSRFNVNYNTADDGECDGEILRRIEIAEVRSGGCGKY